VFLVRLLLVAVSLRYSESCARKKLWVWSWVVDVGRAENKSPVSPNDYSIVPRPAAQGAASDNWLENVYRYLVSRSEDMHRNISDHCCEHHSDNLALRHG